MIKYDQFKKYLEKSNDPYGKLYPAQYIMSDDRHGFVTYDIIEDKIIGYQIYGNGVHWLNHLKSVAKERGIHEIQFFTTRPRAFKRAYGAEELGSLMKLEI